MQTAESIQAVCINKSTGRFPDDHLFRLVFQTPRGICSFRVSKDTYERAQLGQKDMLTFSKGHLVSFGTARESYIPIMPDNSWLRSLS